MGLRLRKNMRWVWRDLEGGFYADRTPPEIFHRTVSEHHSSPSPQKVLIPLVSFCTMHEAPSHWRLRLTSSDTDMYE
jgi:hypothetical protein